MLRERRQAAAGREAAKDPFFDQPQPLWWMPLDIPARMHIVVSCSDVGACWDVLHVRQWTRGAMIVPPMTQAGMQQLLQRVLSRASCGAEWGQTAHLLLHAMVAETVPASLSDTVLQLRVAFLKGEASKNAAAAAAAEASKTSTSRGGRRGGGKQPAGGAVAASAVEHPGDEFLALLPRTGEPMLDAVVRFLTKSDTGTPAERQRMQALRSPGLMRLALARLSFAQTLSDVFQLLVEWRCGPVPSPKSLSSELLLLCLDKFPLAADALGLLHACPFGLQGAGFGATRTVVERCCSFSARRRCLCPEFELVELLGGSGFGPINPQRVGIAHVFGLGRKGHRKQSFVGSLNPYDLAGAADEIACGRNPSSGQAVLPALPASSPTFTMVEWCELRTLLRSFALVQGRGVYCLESGFVREAVEQVLLFDPPKQAEFCQRLIGYFWMQHPGQRKAEVLPPLILRMLYFAHRAAHEKAEATASAALAAEGAGGAGAGAGAGAGLSTPADTGDVGRRRRTVGQHHGISSAMLTSKPPSLLFAVGLSASAAFPTEPRALSSRILAVFTTLPLLSFVTSCVLCVPVVFHLFLFCLRSAHCGDVLS